jgi:5-methylcytosine-specific restriction endonuclease McrA
MKGLDWGGLYDKFYGDMFDTAKMENEIQELMMDDDVNNKKGIYPYVLTRNEKYLNIRAFTDGQKRIVYEKQKGMCLGCGKHFAISEMEADHITPWCEGGKTMLENCQALCKECNRRKSNK